jgi:hypothetical protein
VRELAALVCIVKNSHRLTAQQNEQEDFQVYPSGYKAERAKAQNLSEELIRTVIRRHEESSAHFDELEGHLSTARARRPNSLQRDLPEVGEPFDDVRFANVGDAHIFLHDNEHEMRARDGSETCPWVRDEPGMDNDEWSEGEYVPPLTVSQ